MNYQPDIHSRKDETMSVAGYNVDPESDDPVIGVEIETANEIFNGQAAVYIEETEIHLDWYELKAHIWACNRVLREMEWNQTHYAYASAGPPTDTEHLVYVGNAKVEETKFAIEPTACKFEKALCGRPAPVWPHSEDVRGWDIDPVLSNDPCIDKICKRCYAKWQKLQQQKG